MKNKDGVSMVILVATVVIAIVVMSVSVVSIRNSVKNAELTSITEEYTEIQKAVEEYYLLNGKLPNLDDIKYTKSTVLTMLSGTKDMATKKAMLEEEIEINNESDETYFMKVSLRKINVDNAVRGNAILLEGEDLNTPSKDIYIVAYPSLNIYYLAGVKIEKTYYFSLAKLSKASGISESVKNQGVEEFISGDLSVKKKRNTWTSQIGVEITTFISNTEALYITIPNGNGGKIEKSISVTQNDTNAIMINDLTDVGFTSEESQIFKNLSGESRKIIITKKDADKIVGNVTLDLSNYETTAPVVGNTIVKESYPEYNTFSFDVSDNLSGVESLKYEYYEKRGILENTVLLDDETMYEKQNILKNGKVVKVQNNKATIKVPKNIVSIKYVVTDKAGNSTDVITLDTKYPLFIGYSTVSGTKNSITFNISVESPSAVNSVKTYLSNDGITYNSEYDHGSVTRINNFTYLDISNMYDYLFVKIVVTSGSITETRVIQIDVTDFVSEGTSDKAKVNWNNPYIPKGFVHTEGTVLTGYVIQDVTNSSNKYNEFVWVPVDYIYDNTTLTKDSTEGKTKLEKLWAGWTYNETSSTTSDIDSTITSNADVEIENTEYSKLMESVEKYGGFYVARYEAGDFSAVEARNESSSISNKAVTKKGSYVYNYVGLDNGAVELSRNMYVDSSDIASCLMYGCQYDAILHFMNMNGYNVSNSETYGNYSDTLIKTGSNESTKVLNIYDLAGNVAEWTMEVQNESLRVVRGGAITNDGSLNPVSYRLASLTNNLSNMIGFRPVLYIK